MKTITKIKGKQKMNDKFKEEAFQQTLIVQGIANAILKMAMPQIKNLNEMLNQFGYEITKIK